MAYRKSEEINEGIEARKARLLSATFHVIAKSGLAGFTMGAVATRAKLSEGLVYKYWADKTELLAAATAQVIARDLDHLRDGDLQRGLRAWAKQLADDYRVMSVIGTLPIYSEAIKMELRTRLLREGAGHPTLASAVVYGAVLEAAGNLGPRDVTPLLAALMAACGLKVRVAA